MSFIDPFKIDIIYSIFLYLFLLLISDIDSVLIIFNYLHMFSSLDIILLDLFFIISL